MRVNRAAGTVQWYANGTLRATHTGSYLSQSGNYAPYLNMCNIGDAVDFISISIT